MTIEKAINVLFFFNADVMSRFDSDEYERVNEAINKAIDVMKSVILPTDKSRPVNMYAHRLMSYVPVGVNNAERIGEYNIIYHGDRLYSIRRVDKDAVVLLHADSPHEAWRKAVEMYERVD